MSLDMVEYRDEEILCPVNRRAETLHSLYLVVKDGAFDTDVLDYLRCRP